MDSLHSAGMKRSCPENSLARPIKLEKLQLGLVKENIPPENMDVSKAGQNYDPLHFLTSVKATPKKCLQFTEDPTTPNANINMLMTLAARMDYAKCDTPKSIKLESDSVMDYNEEEIDFESSLKPNRKEKSLSLVCYKFLCMYPLYPKSNDYIIVSLDEVSIRLQVERRRLYDIVNVFESIEMLTKTGKNRYQWFGKSHLLKALKYIKAAAIKENVQKKLQYVLETEDLFESYKQSCILNEVQSFNKQLDFEEDPEIKKLISPSSPYPEVRKEKSLAIMSQKFLMLFLVSPSKVVSLGVAAKILNGFQKNNKGTQVKTQIRRLYDIANVLSSVGLVQKQSTKEGNGKKPAFKYTGPDLDAVNDIKASQQNVTPKQLKGKSLIRHASFQEILSVAELEHQKLLLEEGPKSAPPFEKNMKDANKKTSFENFSILKKSSPRKISILKSTQNGSIVAKNASESSQFNPVTNLTKELPKNKTILPRKQNPILVHKQEVVSNGMQKIEYFIVNNNIPASSNSTGTMLLLNNFVPVTPLTGEAKAQTINRDVTSQVIELSPVQRDAILKSLNLSLSDGQYAAIQLSGASHSTTSSLNAQNNLRIVDMNSCFEKDTVNHSYGKTSPIVILNCNESDGSSNISGTENNSPSFRHESPFSIPSGYATPVPSTSDIMFPSNSEVDSVLMKLENVSDTQKNLESHHFNIKEVLNEDTKNQNSMNSHDFQQVLKSETALQVESLQDAQPNSNSCSNESLNAEVSNILKETPLGETISNSQSFLFDETTMMSPNKKQNGSQKSSTPSPLLTPPLTENFVYPNTIVKVYDPNNGSFSRTLILKNRINSSSDANNV